MVCVLQLRSRVGKRAEVAASRALGEEGCRCGRMMRYARRRGVMREPGGRARARLTPCRVAGEEWRRPSCTPCGRESEKLGLELEGCIIYVTWAGLNSKFKRLSI